MKIIFLTILFGLFTVNVLTQISAPPPPLIYSAPDKSQIAEFRADKLGFKVNFPGKPVENVEYLENENIYIFKLYLNGSNKIVKVTDFSFEKSQNIKSAEIFEQKKLEYLSGENNSLEYEKEVSFKNYAGIEFGIKRGYIYQKARVYIVRNKVYEIIIDVTNWHILQSEEKSKVAEFETEAAGFFDSFEIIPIVIRGKTNIALNEKTVNNEIPQAKPAPDTFNSRTKIFESSDGGFKAYFPAKPLKRVNEIEHSFGKGSFTVYMTTSPLSVYGVTYFDLPNTLTEEVEKILNYDNQRNAMINGTNGKLLREDSFEFDKYKGKEYVIYGNDSVVTMRTFFVEQRMFRNLVIFPAKTEKDALTRVKTGQSLIKKFFESFAVTEIPKPLYNAVELPEDFAVRIENETFYSGLFNFSIKIPADYRIFDENETALAKQLGLELSETSTIKNKDILKVSNDRTAILLIATKEEENEQNLQQILTIAAESVSFSVFNPKSLADFYLKELLEENEVITKYPQEEIIGGENFAWVETLDKTDNSRHRFYVANINGLAFEISFIFYSNEQLNEFLELLKTANFKTQK